MSLEKHIIDIVRQLRDEVRMGDKRAEQFWNLIRDLLHSDLGGLGVDDHTIYLLASGARALTGDWDVGAFSVRVNSLKIRDWDDSHSLELLYIDDALADRTLSLSVAGGDYQLHINGHSYINQSVLTTAAPSFAGLTLTEPLVLTGNGKAVRHIRVGGGSWQLGAAPPAPGFWSVFPTLDFDTSADEEVHYTLMVPHDWDGTTDIEFVVDWAHAVASTAGVAWALEYRSIEPGEGIGGVTVTLVEPSGATVQDVMQRTVFSPCIAASDLAPGDTIGLRLYRDVSNGGDTLAGDARLINTHFHVTVDKLGLAV